MHTARELNATLSDAKIEKVNQPSKDSIVFSLHKNYSDYKLIINANADFARVCVTNSTAPAPITAPSFCMLLRKHLSKATIDRIYAVRYERIIVFDLKCRDELGTPSDKQLYCEIMGKYSNVTLVEDGKIVGALKTTGLNESLLRPIFPGAKYVLPTPQEKFDIDSATDYEKAFAGYDPSSDLAGFIFNNFKGISFQTAVDVTAKYYAENNNPPVVKSFDFAHYMRYFNDYYENPTICPTIVSDGKKSDFYVVRPIAVYPYSKRCSSINELGDTYYSTKENRFIFTLKQNRLTDATRAYEKKLRKKLQIAMDKLVSCADMETNRIFGELIIAYMYKIKQGDKFAEVEDYTKEDYPLIKIPLDETLSPKANAERYFKRYTKQKKTVAAVKPQVEDINEKLKYIETIYAEIESAETDDDFSDIEEELVALDILKKKTSSKKKTTKLSKPRRYQYRGFEVLVGRNNLQNDRLTLSADRNDIWLHTKDYHSAHVIIKADGSEVPPEVILFAAETCAFFSKAKTATKVPVDYTLKKFVKKPAGAPIGTVYYTNQKTIIVDPKDPSNVL